MSLESISSLEVDAAIPSAPADPWPHPRQAWYAVSIFALALTMNFLDRGIISLLFQPLKHDLHLSDVQLGLITGLAFSLFYAFLGIPIARLADVGVRRTIVGVGIAVWSVMTAACGLAGSFWQLFLFRVGVGAGEACNGPATFSMLADYFPREKLPRAIAVLNFGFIAGTGLASLLGGIVIHLLSNTPPATLPILGTLHVWQLTFMAVGIPGLLVSALLWTVKEPPRRGRLGDGGKNGRPASMPIRDVVRFFIDNRATYVPMFVGLGCNTIMAFGIQAWTPEYFRRSFGWAPADLAMVLGVCILIVAPFGAMCGSWLAERLEKQGRDDANLRVVVFAAILLAPGLLAFSMAPTAWIAIGCFCYTQFVSMWNVGPQNAALQVVTPNQMRGQITALFLFIFNLVGFGMGPTIVAMTTEYVYGAENMLRYSIATVVIVLAPCAVLSLWWGLKAYARSVAVSKTWG